METTEEEVVGVIRWLFVLIFFEKGLKDVAKSLLGFKYDVMRYLMDERTRKEREKRIQNRVDQGLVEKKFIKGFWASDGNWRSDVTVAFRNAFHGSEKMQFCALVDRSDSVCVENSSAIVWLVGNSGVGKSWLSIRLSSGEMIGLETLLLLSGVLSLL
jgi:hypothetical protein